MTRTAITLSLAAATMVLVFYLLMYDDRAEAIAAGALAGVVVALLAYLAARRRA